MAAHATLSPSAAKRWMSCPGSARKAAEFENRSSEFAVEGTDAHWLGQAIIEGNLDDTFSPVKLPSGATATQEMFDAVMVYVNWVNEQIHPDDEWGVEERLRLNDDVWGTADFWRYRPSTGELLIADYKHGKGVAVEVKDNPQVLVYGLMKARAMGNRGISSVTMTIVQPRCPHEDGPIRSATVDALDVLSFEADLMAAIAATKAPDAPLVAGDWCRWCPAAGACAALRDTALTAAKTDFAPGLAYDPAELKEALDRIPLMESWIKATRELAFTEALAGNAIPGWKLVEKRATRKWANEIEAGSALSNLIPEDELFERSIITPAQAEKKLGKTGKAAIAGLVVAESSGLTLVHESDKRPAAAARATAAEDFGAA